MYSLFKSLGLFLPQNSRTNLNGVRLLMPLSRPSSAYLAHNRISRIARISSFHRQSPVKKIEKLQPHPPQQNAAVNERSQIWPPLHAVQGLGVISS
jgi:hypothetical protein